MNSLSRYLMGVILLGSLGCAEEPRQPPKPIQVKRIKAVYQVAEDHTGRYGHLIKRTYLIAEDDTYVILDREFWTDYHEAKKSDLTSNYYVRTNKWEPIEEFPHRGFIKLEEDEE